MHYIGMDCHITTLEFAVVSEAGRLVKAHRVTTSVNDFMEFVKTVPSPRTIYMEGGSLAAQYNSVSQPLQRFHVEKLRYLEP